MYPAKYLANELENYFDFFGKVSGFQLSEHSQPFYPFKTEQSSFLQSSEEDPWGEIASQINHEKTAELTEKNLDFLNSGFEKSGSLPKWNLQNAPEKNSAKSEVYKISRVSSRSSAAGQSSCVSEAVSLVKPLNDPSSDIYNSLDYQEKLLIMASDYLNDPSEDTQAGVLPSRQVVPLLIENEGLRKSYEEKMIKINSKMSEKMRKGMIANGPPEKIKEALQRDNNRVYWAYQINKKTFREYPDWISKYIEKCFAKGSNEAVIQNQYKIDFFKWKEVNLNNQERSVKRVNSVKGPALWKFKKDRNWINFEEFEVFEIEKNWLAKDMSFCTKSNIFIDYLTLTAVTDGEEIPISRFLVG